MQLSAMSVFAWGLLKDDPPPQSPAIMSTGHNMYRGRMPHQQMPGDMMGGPHIDHSGDNTGRGMMGATSTSLGGQTPK